MHLGLSKIIEVLNEIDALVRWDWASIRAIKEFTALKLTRIINKGGYWMPLVNLGFTACIDLFDDDIYQTPLHNNDTLNFFTLDKFLHIFFS